MTEWAYHATQTHYLPSIKRRGLVPSVNEGLVYEYEHTPPMLYFMEEFEWVQDYGDVFLRFPYPSDAEDATYKWGTEGMVTYKTIPPSQIDIYDERSNMWRPLITKRRKTASSAFGEISGGILREVSIGQERKVITLTDNQQEVLRPIKHLGLGTTASAYLRDDGKVVKFTVDYQDVIGLSISQGVEHVAKIYEVYELPQTIEAPQAFAVEPNLPVYAIVMKRYADFPDHLYWIYKRPMAASFVRDTTDPLWKMYIERPMERQRGQYTGAIPLPPHEEALELARKFMLEMHASAEGLTALGIEMTDLHEGNMMYDPDTGDWVFVDLGRSKLPKEQAAKVSTYLEGLGRWFHTRRSGRR